MVLGALPGDVVPDLPEEAVKVLLGKAALLPLLLGGLAVPPGFLCMRMYSISVLMMAPGS